MIRRHFSFPSIFPNYVSSSIVIAPNLFNLVDDIFSLLVCATCTNCAPSGPFLFPFSLFRSGFASSFALLGPTLTTSPLIASTAYHRLPNRNGFHRTTYRAIQLVL